MTSLVQDPFTFGFLSGALFIIALTPVIFWFSYWTRQVMAFFKPQFVVQTTKKTPFQVFLQMLSNILWALILILVIYLVARYFFPDFSF